MARPFNRNQQLENRAFLKQLRLTGNVREAARVLGVHRSTFVKRRNKHPLFAAQWDAALAVADASARAAVAANAPARAGTPRVVNVAGQLQLRRATSGRLTRAARQAFLAALSASANVRLAAAAAGFSHSAFYRLRARDPGFAREMRWAVQEGYRRLNEALLAGFLPDAHEDDAWRHNDAPELPRMTAAQALQLMYLHQKEAVLPWGAALHRRRGKGLEEALRQAQAGAQYDAMIRRRAEEDVRDGLARLAAKLGVSPHEEAPVLPDLSQVAASRADPAKGGHSDRALFGGWRLEQLTPEQRALGAARLDQRRGGKG